MRNRTIGSFLGGNNILRPRAFTQILSNVNNLLEIKFAFWAVDLEKY